MQVGNEIWSDDDARRRTFTALSKHQMAPVEGSRPIGWLQAHMCHAIDVLVERLVGGQVLSVATLDKFGALAHGEVRVRNGQMEGRVAGETCWRSLGLTPREVYNLADRRSRT